MFIAIILEIFMYSPAHSFCLATLASEVIRVMFEEEIDLESAASLVMITDQKFSEIGLFLDDVIIQLAKKALQTINFNVA